MSHSNSSSVQPQIYKRFHLIKRVGSGAYGHVWKVQQKSSKKVLALKKIFDAFQHSTDAQRTYRQIQILKQTHHPNIIKLHDTLKADNNNDVYLVFDYMQSDLHHVNMSNILKQVHIRFVIYQIAKALKYLHSGSVIHRDLKPSNILIDSNCVIKLCDFGLVRSISVKDDIEPVLTEGVATRWYRAPEVLLGSRTYSTPADVWSFGCIIYEILAKRPLFAGNSTMDQVEKLCQHTGYPSQEDINSLNSQSARLMLKQIKQPKSTAPLSKTFQKIPSQFLDLLQKMIVFNPSKRITIDQTLQHQCVKMFHRPEEVTVCDKEFILGVDDNRKLTVDEYRKLIYSQASNSDTKTKREVVGMISKSTSLHVIRKADISSGASIEGKSQKTQINRTRSFRAFKPQTQQRQKPLISFLSPKSIKPTQTTFKKDQTEEKSHKKNSPSKQQPSENSALSSLSPHRSKEIKWAPKFLVRKSPINDKTETNATNLSSAKITNPSGKSLKNLLQNKPTRPIHATQNRSFFSSKNSQQILEKQTQTVKKTVSTNNLTNNREINSFSPEKKTSFIAGNKYLTASFTKFVPKNQQNAIDTRANQDRVSISNKKQANQKFTVWTSKKNLLSKQATINTKSRQYSFASQKYIKHSDTRNSFQNPESVALTKSEMEKVEE